jgi:hypothetical protein
MRTHHILSLVALSALSALSAGCAGTSFARQTNALAIPAGGPGPNPLGMPVQMMEPREWTDANEHHLEPVCDSRTKKVQAEPLKDAKRVVELWVEFNKAHPKKPRNTSGDVTVGQLVGIPTATGLRIDSLNVSCAPGAPFTIEVNGATHAFDMLWAVASAGTRVSFQAFSQRENLLFFAEVTVPSTPKGEPQEIVLSANISNYIPENAQDPIVRNLRATQIDVLFETLVVGKGTTEGFYWLAPRAANFGGDRTAVAGRFKVGS